MVRILRRYCQLIPKLQNCMNQLMQRNNFYSQMKDEWHFKDMKSFGDLHLNSKQPAVFVIQPIDPVTFHHQDQVMVKSSQSQRFTCTAHSKTEVNTCDSEIENAPKDGFLHCEHLIPIKYNIHANLENNASVYVKGMEGGNIKVVTEQGSCILNNIKGEEISVCCGGPVTSQIVLHGNGKIQTTGSANIHIDKALGTDFSLLSEAGDIHVDSLYVEKTSIKTQTGNISVKACHRNNRISVKEKGNISIGTLDGDLTAEVKNGGVDVHISQHENVNIHVTKGDITLKLAESLCSQIYLEANKIDISDNITYREDSCPSRENKLKVISGEITDVDGKASDRKIVAICKEGTISIQHLDWISSLCLGKTLET